MPLKPKPTGPPVDIVAEAGRLSAKYKKTKTPTLSEVEAIIRDSYMPAIAKEMERPIWTTTTARDNTISFLTASTSAANCYTIEPGETVKVRYNSATGIWEYDVK